MKRLIERLIKALISSALLITAVLCVTILPSAVSAFTPSDQNFDTPEDVTTEVSETEPQQTENIVDQTHVRDDSLQYELQMYLESNGLNEQNIAFCIEDMEYHDVYSFNTDATFFAASVYKLPLAMLYEDMIAQGKYTRDSLLYFDYYMIEDNGYLLSCYSPGTWVPLGDILDIMIRYSDNTAGHILFETMGGWLKYREAMLAYTDETCFAWDTYDNVICAAVMSDVLSHLYENRSRYENLIEVMSEATPHQFLDSIIQVNMPQKYGSYEYARNSAGFVDGEHPYTIVVLTALGNYGETVMADLNAIAYRHFYDEENT